MNVSDELEGTVRKLLRPGMGILAADESLPTIAKRFLPLGIAETEEMRRAYRSLLFAAPGIEPFIGGAILFEETLLQRDGEGKLLPEVLEGRGIVPGIKVDKGTTALVNAPGNLVTQGLDGLSERLKIYQSQGARFAKWRAVYNISERNPTPLAVAANSDALASYAAICQAEGIVPIVEPEVLMDGAHSMARCQEVTEDVLHAVFSALRRHRVILERMLLKPGMVLPGKEHPVKASPEQVAASTIETLKRAVPAAVPGVCFLSGGQRPEEATANLNAMNASFPAAPWQLSFSYGRALQDPVLKAWRGRVENVPAAQAAFFHRAQMNSLARRGQWSSTLEKGAEAGG